MPNRAQIKATALDSQTLASYLAGGQSLAATDLLTNGNMETGSPPSSWSSVNTATLTSAADERTGGAGAASIDVERGGASNSPTAQQILTVTAGKWFVLDGWMRLVDNTNIEMRLVSSSMGRDFPPTPFYTGTDWAYNEGIARALTTSLVVRGVAITANAGESGRFDDLRVRLLTLNTQNVLPTANAQIEADVTLDESPYIGQRIIVAYRIQGTLESEHNCWQMELVRNEANDDWDMFLYSVASGVLTERRRVDSIGAPEIIRVDCYGSKHQMYSYASDTWTPRGAVVDVSHMDTATGVNVITSEGMSVTAYRASASTPF